MTQKEDERQCNGPGEKLRRVRRNSINSGTPNCESLWSALFHLNSNVSFFNWIKVCDFLVSHDSERPAETLTDEVRYLLIICRCKTVEVMQKYDVILRVVYVFSLESWGSFHLNQQRTLHRVQSLNKVVYTLYWFDFIAYIFIIIYNANSGNVGTLITFE